MVVKKIIFSLLALSLLGLLVGLLFKNSIEVGLCLETEPTCINNMTMIGDGLFYGISALALVFLLLLFLPSAFPAWKKFAVWFIPIAALIFIFYRGGNYFDPFPEQIYQWVSTIYVILSILIIAWSEIKRRKNLNLNA